jgi:RHS repeat-associated protein
LPGQYHDRETGLYYNYHRYYDPKIGAYINQDPIGLGGDVNPYSYVGDPCTWIDPLGLKGKRKVPRKLAAALSPDKIKDLVANNNNSGLPNETIECLIWKESSFKPRVPSKTSTALGLMQMTSGAVDDVNANSPSLKHFTHAGMTNAADNVAAGTAYLKIRIDREGGDIDKGMNVFGTGGNYSESIKTCSGCLQEARKNKLSCKEEQKCFNMANSKS